MVLLSDCLVHVILGVGYPITKHCKVVVWPRSTTGSLTISTVRGTAMKGTIQNEAMINKEKRWKMISTERSKR